MSASKVAFVAVLAQIRWILEKNIALFKHPV
jgi:hypothetical protein